MDRMHSVGRVLTEHRLDIMPVTDTMLLSAFLTMSSEVHGDDMVSTTAYR